MTEYQKNFQERMHKANIRVSKGYSMYISSYLTLASLISIPTTIIAKLFPELTLGASGMAILSFMVLVFVSWWLGKRYEKMEEKMNGHVEEKVAL